MISRQLFSAAYMYVFFISKKQGTPLASRTLGVSQDFLFLRQAKGMNSPTVAQKCFVNVPVSSSLEKVEISPDSLPLLFLFWKQGMSKGGLLSWPMITRLGVHVYRIVSDDFCSVRCLKVMTPSRKLSQMNMKIVLSPSVIPHPKFQSCGINRYREKHHQRCRTNIPSTPASKQQHVPSKANGKKESVALVRDVFFLFPLFEVLWQRAWCMNATLEHISKSVPTPLASSASVVC